MRSLGLLGFALLSTGIACGQTRIATLAQRVLDAGLDPEECYRVRDLHFTRDDLRFYLTDGFLIFSKPLDGARTFAVFSAEVEGGDAEVLVFPPQRSERLSLASYTASPNLSEHFRSAVFVFTDDTYRELSERIRARDVPRRNAERGELLASSWREAVRNFGSSFQVRLVADLLSGQRAAGLFYAALSGAKLGNFDVVYDPLADEQITAGQVVSRDNRSFFDVWTRFQARAFRNGTRTVPASRDGLSDYRIDATVDPDLRMRVLTKATLRPTAGETRALVFYISHQMRVTEARIDGQPAEVFQPDSLRATLIRGTGNDAFVVAPATELDPARPHEIEFRHEGNVISAAGNNVYFVGARGSWYPNRGMHFERYDLTFRYPKQLSLVSTGELVEERTEGDSKVCRRKTEAPIRFAGFNLGDYERQAVKRGGYTVEVYANRRLEKALEARVPRLILLPQPTLPPNPQQWPGRMRGGMDAALQSERLPEPAPSERAERLANEVAAGLDFMASRFGPIPLKTLLVSPIPGTFGQGFPGLIYLSTLSYLDPQERPASARTPFQETFFSEILSAHETAHQWWGNLVTVGGYQDEWLMEALANYSSLLYLEKRKGRGALDAVLGEFRNRLTAKTEGGRVVESAGPIVWGTRLENSHVPGAARTIIYDKGAWIMHMMRRRMGDDRFAKMLFELRRRYEYKSVTTEQFRALAGEFNDPKAEDRDFESFFDQWVYGTGIPALKMTYTVRGKAPSVRVNGTITQSDTDADFSAYVPVEIQVARGKSTVQWVRTVSGPVTFSATLRQAPLKVSLDPGNAVLRK